MFGRNKPIPQSQPTSQPISSVGVMKISDELMTMPFPTLRDIKERVDAAIAARTEEARASFIEQLEMFGLTLDDVRPAKKKRNAKVKYRDPDNPENTWSGVGKPKKWLQAYVDAGRSIEEFAVA